MSVADMGGDLKKQLGTFFATPSLIRDPNNYVQPGTSRVILRSYRLAFWMVVVGALFLGNIFYSEIALTLESRPCTSLNLDVLRQCAAINRNPSSCNYCSAAEEVNEQQSALPIQLFFKELVPWVTGNPGSGIGTLSETLDDVADFPDYTDLRMLAVPASPLFKTDYMRLACSSVDFGVDVPVADPDVARSTREAFSIQIERPIVKPADDTPMVLSVCARFFTIENLAVHDVCPLDTILEFAESKVEAARSGTDAVYEYCCLFSVLPGLHTYDCLYNTFVGIPHDQQSESPFVKVQTSGVSGRSTLTDRTNVVAARSSLVSTQKTRPGERPNDKTDTRPDLRAVDFSIYAATDALADGPSGIGSLEFFQPVFGQENTGLLTPYDFTLAAIISNSMDEPVTVFDILVSPIGFISTALTPEYWTTVSLSIALGVLSVFILIILIAYPGASWIAQSALFIAFLVSILFLVYTGLYQDSAFQEFFTFGANVLSVGTSALSLGFNAACAAGSTLYSVGSGFIGIFY